MRLYADQPSGTVGRARQLRRDAPEPERRLLRALREAFPTYKWRHQAPVGCYYVDILCWSQRLAIEVDGDTHAGRADYDEARTGSIQREGYRVIRFCNNDVLQNLDGVLRAIDDAILSSPSPSHSAAPSGSSTRWKAPRAFQDMPGACPTSCSLPAGEGLGEIAA